jgi:hypothetical protein
MVSIQTTLTLVIYVFYPAIPLYCFFTCFFFLFLYDGKHTSLSLPLFDPIIERTTLLNSSLISCILLSMVPTKVAAAGFSQINRDLECDPLTE